MIFNVLSWKKTLFTEQVDNLDRLLDELEDLARSDLPSSRFFATAVERLRLTLSAQSVVLLLPAAGADWLPIAMSGANCTAPQAELSQRVQSLAGQAPQRLMGCAEGMHWLAIPLRPNSFSKGCLLTCAASPFPSEAVHGVAELMSAFCEVVTLRQQFELESFLDDTWEKTQSLCLQINASKSYPEAATVLACDLTRVLGAARVTVLSVGALTGPKVQAVSGVPHASSRVAAVQALRVVGEEVVRSGKPVLREQPHLRGPDGQLLPELAPDGSFANLIGLRLSSTDTRRSRAAQSDSTLLVIEYQTYPEMVRCATKLSHLLPTIAVAWEQHTRWLRLPRVVRLLSLGPLQALRSTLPLLKWGALLGGVCLALWVLHKPVPLFIEAEGAYQPITSRAVYATDDGFVEELLIDDGTQVKTGDPLVQLRSPALELRIEQTEGATRAVEEEVNGIRIAINQLSSDAPDFLSNQSRLAGKIAELDLKKQSLQSQMQLLAQQRTRLLLLAPIDGNVVAKDLRRNLASRPVRRGDSLFSIVEQAGPWHVRVHVPDRDVGYVLKHFSPRASLPPEITDHRASEKQEISARELQSEIEFCLSSAPDQRFPAEVTWIADQVENRHGEGCTVEVRATVGSERPVGTHAGSSVYAFFDCGNQPMWFVWCRPLVEAAQRRMWFRGPDDK